MIAEIILTDVYDPGGNIWSYKIEMTTFGAIDIIPRYRGRDEQEKRFRVFPDHWPGLVQKVNEMLALLKEIDNEARRVYHREQDEGLAQDGQAETR